MWRKAALCGALLVASATPTVTGMTAMGLYATEFTQLLNYAQLAAQLQKQIQMVSTALQQFAHMRLQGQLFSAMQWGTLTQDLVSLSSVVRQGSGLAYTMSNLDRVFRAAYPGYLQNGVSFNTQYAGWQRTSMDTIAGVLAALNVHASQLNSDQAVIGMIRSFAGSAQGQDQLLQAGTMIADQQVQQLEKLRQLMMLQVQSEALYQGRQANLESVQQNARANSFGDVRFTPTN